MHNFIYIRNASYLPLTVKLMPKWSLEFTYLLCSLAWMPLIIRPKLDMELKIYNTQTVITPSKLKAAFTQSHYSRTVFFSFDTIGENTVGKEFKMGKEFKKFRKAVFVLLIDHLNSFFYPKKTCQCLQYVFSHLIQHYKT